MATAATTHRFNAVRLQQTRAARTDNLLALAEPVVSAGSLDSNIKKNTTFVKKLSKITHESLSTIELDLKKLKVDKYLTEIVSSLLENFNASRKYTVADIDAIATVVSLLHRRFTDSFTPLLVEQIQKILSLPSAPSSKVGQTDQREKDEKERIGKTRGLIRLWCELYLLGLLTPMDAPTSRGIDSGMSLKVTPKKDKVNIDNQSATDEVFLAMLREALSLDREHSNAQNIVTLARSYGAILFPARESITTSSGNATDESGELPQNVRSNDETPQDSILLWPVSDYVRVKAYELASRFFESLSNRLVKEHKLLRELEHKNNEWYYQRGTEPPEDFKARYERVKQSSESCKANVQILTELLHLEAPVLEGDDDIVCTSSMIILGTNADGSEREIDFGIWEDEDQKTFYEGVADLINFVPSSLLKSDYKPKQRPILDTKSDDTSSTTVSESANVSATTAQPLSPSTAEIASVDETNPPLDVMSSSKPEEEELEEEDQGANSKLGDEENGPEEVDGVTRNAHFLTFLARLPTLTNRDLIDHAAVDFVKYNTKNARKRLIKTLLEIPKSRHDIIPYYARLIATLSRYFPDISDGIIDALEAKFRQQVRRVKESSSLQEVLEPKIATVKYLSELAKFRVVPPQIIFFAFKQLLQNFSTRNIEVTCAFLESCGRFLYQSVDIKVRMLNMLETLQRKAKAMALENRLQLMLENAYFTCVPTEAHVKAEKERSDVEKYARHLLFRELTRNCVERVLDALRKLPWSDEAVQTFMYRLFTKIWKAKYSNIQLMAALMGGLARYHSIFSIDVVDFVLEEIRFGMEQNLFKHNQRRIAVIKYLGELYNYRIVNSLIIFDALYSLLTFGYENSLPIPNHSTQLDANDDYFRIRLVCTLLETCGVCFDRGMSKVKLDAFLIFFQMYIHCKVPPPMDIEYLIQDTFELLRPKETPLDTYEKALQAMQVMMQTVQEPTGNVENVEDEDEAPTSDEDESKRNLVEDSNQGDHQDNAPEMSFGEDNALEVDPDDDVVVVHVDEKQISKEEEEAFDRELNQLMMESLEGRRFERPKGGMLNVPLPKTSQSKAPEVVEDDRIAFALVTKKNNKPQTKFVEVPVYASFAQAVISNQEDERAEREVMKRLVLNYERNEEESHMRAMTTVMQEKEKQDMVRRNKKVKKVLVISGGSGGRFRGSNARDVVILRTDSSSSQQGNSSENQNGGTNGRGRGGDHGRGSRQYTQHIDN